MVRTFPGKNSRKTGKLLNFQKVNHSTDIPEIRAPKSNGTEIPVKKTLFHSSDWKPNFLYWMESAPGNSPRKFISVPVVPVLKIHGLMAIWRLETPAYNESINYCVLFAFSQLSVGFCLFKSILFLIDEEVLKDVLLNSPRILTNDTYAKKMFNNKTWYAIMNRPM